MANHASALKAHRQSLKRRQRNRSNRSSLRTVLKHYSEQLEAGRIEDAKKSIPQICAVVDKAVQKKALSPNAASRHKSRLTKRLNDALMQSAKK